MHRRFEYWVGNRYVRSRSSNNFVSLISAISIFGIAIAVAVLIIVLSVVNGFDRELRERLLTMTAHGNVEAVDGELDEWGALSAKATSNPRVRAAAPYVSGQGLLVIGERLSGVEMRGIDPVAEALVSGVKNVMTEGEVDSLESGTFNIVLGVELAKALQAGIGDKVTVILAQGIVTPAGVLPRTKRFTVSGLYRVGMFEYDRRLAFINIQDAQRLYRMRDAVTGVRLAVTEIYDAAEIVYEVAHEPGEDVFPIHWQRRHFNFFRSIQITKSILSVILFLVVAVAAFNIVSTLVMVVKDKQSDIAILKTIGARPSSIVRIFVTQGSIIGVAGTFFGVLAGILLALNLEAIVSFFESSFGIKFLAADVYFISDLPAELHVPDVVKIASAALMMALLSTVYPAWMAARTAPAEALRYD